MKCPLAFALLLATCVAQDSPKVTDKKFWAITAFSAAATAADGYTTVNSGECTMEIGNPFLYGVHPTAKRVTLVMGGIYVASVGVSYFLKRHHAKVLWMAPELAPVVGHVQGAVHNARTCY